MIKVFDSEPKGVPFYSYTLLFLDIYCKQLAVIVELIKIYVPILSCPWQDRTPYI